MKRFMIYLVIYTVLTFILIVLVGALVARSQSAAQSALVRATSDVEVHILPNATEIVLPVGASFVFNRQSDGRVALRFVHLTPPPGIGGKPLVP